MGGEVEKMNNLKRIQRGAISIACILLMLLVPGSLLLAQDPAPQAPPPAAAAFPPQQLDALVAPIALYPDALLGQILVASTYPLELVEAAQWLRQNRALQGTQLMDAARQQNWDPSIQALVAFPDVINRMTSDVRWMTDLGNAFLAQQADVMNAVQRLRSQAMAAGKLASTSQETVTTQTQGGQTAINIQPADPQVVYVPTYNPEYVWGPPDYGYYYPPLYYPAIGFGFGWGPGIYIGSFFGGLGWGGWGWGPNWFNCSIGLNAFFFNHYGFHNGFGHDGFGRGFGGGFRGGVWAHNAEHRMGVPYANQAVANRFGGSFAGRGGVASSGLAGRQFAAQRSIQQSGGLQHSAGPAEARGQGAGQTRSFSAARPSSTPGSAGWNHFGGSNSQSVNRSSSPAFNGGASRPAPAYRPAPSNGYRGVPSMQASHSSAGFARSGGHPSAPAFRGNPGGNPGFHGGGAPHSAAVSHGGGGGGFHGGGGGGGSHGGGRR
jgi:hypothetical protein